MAGRRPIFASLVQTTYTIIRDNTFKVVLEPSQDKSKKKKHIDTIDELKEKASKGHN